MFKNRTMKILGAKADAVQLLMISVDPERDVQPKLDEYVRAFDPRFVGLTGSPPEIAEIAADYGIYYAKVEMNPFETIFKGEPMDHPRAKRRWKLKCASRDWAYNLSL